MKIWIPAAAATLALAFSATASAAGGTVSYQCQNDKKISVNYVFNKQGVPTQATATLKGKKRLMKYDLNRSDNVDTYFKDKSGFNISTSNMDASNFREAPIMIFSPDSEILYNDCNPVAPKTSESQQRQNAGKITKTGSVSYMCLNERRLKVNYAFNGAGVPVKAEAILNGRKRTLQYDLNRSGDQDVYFQDRAGYNLSTSYMDANNFRQNAVMVMNPNSEFLYKDCAPMN